ncbi:uncharacterized protein LOC112565080 [Pomacea canaliculata]|uniref:uncharacterized protein LOC112565080 n=1 Tax=Pomacea canaliculata TaxID=400727 RepID=UPI000D731BAA|nr:uncharacterized protein LOC112565080 [Pomacea canaliculata]
MATKRMFYVTASNQNVGRKKNRRPLAQGRLVTSPTPQEANLPHLQQGIVHDTFHHQSVAVDDLNATPRRTIPHATEHQSPRPSPPAEKLDLSDSEEDFVTQVDHGEFQHLPHSQPEVHHVPHVVVLDASAACASPNQVEVECVLGYERTPVQVICHNQQSFSKQSLSNIDEKKDSAIGKSRSLQYLEWEISMLL